MSAVDDNGAAFVHEGTTDTRAIVAASCRYHTTVNDDITGRTIGAATNASGIFTAGGIYCTTVNGNVTAASIPAATNACGIWTACSLYRTTVDGDVTACYKLRTADACFSPSSTCAQSAISLILPIDGQAVATPDDYAPFYSQCVTIHKIKMYRARNSDTIVNSDIAVHNIPSSVPCRAVCIHIRGTVAGLRITVGIYVGNATGKRLNPVNGRGQ